MVPAPVAAPPAQPTRGKGQAAKGRGHTVRGGGQAIRGSNHPARGRPTDVVQGGGAHPQCYDFPARPEAELSDVVITVGDAIIVDRVYRSCVVTIRCLETRIDLLLLDMVDFDIILGMDWLSLYHAILDCHAKTVTLALQGMPRLEWRGTLGHSTSREGKDKDGEVTGEISGDGYWQRSGGVRR
ncbi:uncharacterized protein [Nicotiana tomentosiformis]|uniref:uncharacterized protein n=1 Tax=Nicotiana tomentosiformis TaxID=4098 RepID=UPI00388C4A93